MLWHNTSKPGVLTDREVEGHLGVSLFNLGIEACLLISLETVGQSSSRDRRGQRGQASEDCEPHVE